MRCELSRRMLRSLLGVENVREEGRGARTPLISGRC